VWAVTETEGKRIPLDDPPALVSALVVVAELADGTPVVAVRDGYVTHFATCPDAGRWRRG